jgi:hypothetical protein
VQEITPDFMHRKNNKSKGFSQAFARLARTQMDAWVASMENAFAQMHSAPGSWGGIFLGGGCRVTQFRDGRWSFQNTVCRAQSWGAKGPGFEPQLCKKKKKIQFAELATGCSAHRFGQWGHTWSQFLQELHLHFRGPSPRICRLFFFLHLRVLWCTQLVPRVSLWLSANPWQPTFACGLVQTVGASCLSVVWCKQPSSSCKFVTFNLFWGL